MRTHSELAPALGLGTSSCKDAPYSRNGKSLAITAAAYPLPCPASGFVEQRPADCLEVLGRQRSPGSPTHSLVTRAEKATLNAGKVPLLPVGGPVLVGCAERLASIPTTRLRTFWRPYVAGSRLPGKTCAGMDRRRRSSSFRGDRGRRRSARPLLKRIAALHSARLLPVIQDPEICLCDVAMLGWVSPETFSLENVPKAYVGTELDSSRRLSGTTLRAVHEVL